MSSKNGFVYAVATADTKASQLIYLKEMVAQTGVAVVTVDLSVQRVNHGVQTDFTAGQVAAYHPQGADRVFCRERGEAIKAMALAFTLFLCQRDDVAGVIGLGGSGGTALITPAMQALAVGIPKLMVSSMASGQVSGYVGTSDIAMLYPVTDMSGLNRISRRVLANAARQIAGAVCFASEEQAEETPALGLTMFGVTTPCVEAVSRRLEADFECLVFHATGCGGRAMEKLADDRILDGILDLTTTEVADLLFGGVLACGADRFDALARTRLPCVLSCGALDMINFREPHSIPEKFAGRQFCSHNAWVTLMRTTPQENVQMARWIADKLNRCEGEIRFLIPEGGFSALDAEGQPFWCPAADRAFIRSLEQHLVKSARRQVIRLPWHINDPRFADEAAKQFRQLVANRPAGRQAQ